MYNMWRTLTTLQQNTTREWTRGVEEMIQCYVMERTRVQFPGLITELWQFTTLTLVPKY